MDNTKIPDDLCAQVHVFKIEEAMRHLENVFAPQVTFCEDLDRMRKEADDYRLRQVRLAMQVLYQNVAGLVVRPEMKNGEMEHTCSCWHNIELAPRDGTPIELKNDYGVMPFYNLSKWVDERGWVNANDNDRGTEDGPHLTWRPYVGEISSYRDPTNGAQETMLYWQPPYNRFR